ncbi:putative ABC transporter ATP-binding protein [Clostridium tepidiprofundi DSM 19306]|uniref:Putative ABC transporter ATP-binding protein n=1 Tax=Clostridium tepidiprofundi DSM 19306 TaxID=1121338 RepID=A0A151AWW5_9CLOT|nr:ABC transporter ATP-binding protein [Clostridium tepidiprofundi]KYH32060.1 putative ABC transporter ATP-binding protein [Clostridium tepidiprofundi DSM 19306]
MEIFAIILTFTVACLRLVGPWAQKILIDDVFIKKNTNLLFTTIMVWWLAIIADIFIEALRDYCFTTVGERTIRNLREELYRKLQKQNVSYFKQNGVGAIMYYFTNGIPAMGNLYQNIIPDILFYFVWFCVSLYTIFKLNWKLSLISIPFLILYAIICKLSIKPVRKSSKKVQENELQISTCLQESILAITDIKVNTLEAWDFQKLVSSLKNSLSLL